MSSYLDRETAAFKKLLAAQPVYSRPTPSSTSTAAGGPNLAISRVDGAGTAKKLKKPVYSQPTDTGIATHTLSQLHNVINFLKKVDTPQTAEDLKRQKIADVNGNKELYSRMKDNEKIEYDPEKRTFKYKPEFIIHGSDDLLKLLYERRDSKPCGMHFKDLADSYVDVTDSIKELEDEGKIHVIRLMKDNSPRLMYWNDERENTTMDKEFVDMFRKVVVPDEVDLPKALKDAGLQTMAVLENKSRIESKQKQRKRKQGNRKIKITNTHLNHLDLTKDYTPTKT